MSPRSKDAGKAGLRQRAESRLAATPRDLHGMDAVEVQKLVHELQVHQIELQMQNDELRKTHEALQHSRDELENLFEFAPVGYLILTPDQSIVRANVTAAELLATQRRSLTGCRLWRFVKPAHREEFEKHCHAVRETGAPQTCELAMSRMDGRPLVARFVSTPDRLSDPSHAGFRASFVDVTRRREAEDALRENEKQLHDLVEASSDAILVLRAERITFLNAAAVALLGADNPGDLLERELLSLVDTRDHLIAREQLYRGDSARAAAASTCFRILRADGTIVEVEMTASPFRGLDDQNLVVIMRDVTKRREAEAQSRDIERELIAAGERERRRLGFELHDNLGQRLTAIELHCLTLAQDVDGKDPELVVKVGQVCQWLRETIAQSRALSQGMAPVKAEPTGLMTALKTLSEMTDALGQTTCHFRCGDSVLVPDHAVANHLFRIAQEAVTNALKHGKARSIEITLDEDPAGLKLQVRDDGSGFSADPPIKPGMGLEVMHHRAGLLGADFSADSRLGMGVTVSCLVPKSG